MTDERAKPSPSKDMAADSDQVEVFVDLRSPYSFVAKQPLRRLAADLGVSLRWLPFAIDIEAAYGGAEARDARQRAKAKYIYMDARRLAAPQGLVIRGPIRIFDASLAHRAMLFATRAGLLAPFMDIVFERFFTRAIDIEDRQAILDIVSEIGGDARDAAEYIDGPGREALAEVTARAETHGVFGVPSMVCRGKLFWGADRLEQLRAAITGPKPTPSGA